MAEGGFSHLSIAFILRRLRTENLTGNRSLPYALLTPWKSPESGVLSLECRETAWDAISAPDVAQRHPARPKVPDLRPRPSRAR
jgi:hypothetical protein